ncbi:CLUMA_CG011530, isoform A [Clunio marinus]|uniref:CLUMA_CG011530, isoform A n=1 Tax=Clunio marinus TaxID=568069 RepID=A0A1J1IF32_9DIPT|nr:CLUMA_CG011530, isoform A [Clunio marinus]
MDNILRLTLNQENQYLFTLQCYLIDEKSAYFQFYLCLRTHMKGSSIYVAETFNINCSGLFKSCCVGKNKKWNTEESFESLNEVLLVKKV